MSRPVTQLVPCEVCKRLDDDWTPKECSYCGICDAWMCESDAKNMIRRTRAMLAGKKNPPPGVVPS